MTSVKNWLRRLAWVMAAPVVWVGGCLLLCFSPAPYKVERTPVTGLPQRPLTMDEVASLNQELESCSRSRWHITWSVMLYHEEHYLAVPTAAGGLELVHSCPALVWDGEPAPAVDAVIQKWRAGLNRNGGSMP